MQFFGHHIRSNKQLSYAIQKKKLSIRYISNSSNHPTIIKKHLPKLIEKRLNGLSTEQRTFNYAKHSYQVALLQFNFKQKLENENKTYPVDKKKRKRTRKIMFCNPPYCQSVKTNIGKKFLDLIDKHFKTESMKKIFNRSNDKVSYCCMENVK